MARNEGAKLGVAIAESIGIDVRNCLGLRLNWEGSGPVTIDARLIVTDKEGQLITEDGELKVENRTWTEGEFKRFAPIFQDARDDALPPLYERIDKEG